MLALVEGDTLSPARMAEIERALSSDPAWVSMVRAMKRDRAGLRALAEPTCPPGVIDAVEQVMERRMLVGLSAGIPLDRDEPPVVIVRDRSAKPGWVRLFTQDQTGRRLALAAGLLLVVGGVSYFATTWLAQPRVIGDGTKVATAPDKAFPNPAIQPAMAPVSDHAAAKPTPEIQESSNASRNANTAPADQRDETSSNPSTMFAAAPSVKSPAGIPASPWRGVAVSNAWQGGRSDTAEVAVASTVGDEQPEAVAAVRENVNEPPFEHQQALEWAREQRLVIRVVPGRNDAALDRLMNEAPVPRSGWYLAQQIDLAVASAVPMHEPEPSPDHGLMGAAMMMASGASGLSGTVPVVIPAELLRPQERPRPSDEMLAAAVRLERNSFAALVTNLQRGGQTVTFERLDEPFPTTGRPPVPDSVLWASEYSWAAWGWVPVVIER